MKKVLYIIIYKATNIKNKKIYIGQTTKTLSHRKFQHKNESYNTNRKNTYFHNAIVKYGFECFEFDIIEYLNSTEELNNREQYWISFYNSNDKKYGYNLDSGGKNCLKSESTKRKIGDTSLAKWKNRTIAVKMREGLDKGRRTIIANSIKNKIEWTCPVCGKSLRLTNSEIKTKQYCSLSCNGKSDKNLDNLKNMSEINRLKKSEWRLNVESYVLSWCKANKKEIEDCKYNSIEKGLRNLMCELNIEYGISDLRSLFGCFPVKNRKELLKYLKNYINTENVC